MFGKTSIFVKNDQIVKVWMSRQAEFVASAKNLKHLPEIGHGMSINGHAFKVVDITHIWNKDKIEVHIFVERI